MASSLVHVCVTQSEIDESPSRRDGVSAETETLLRRYGCEMIDDLGTLLELSQMAIATAQTLFHRFYCVLSFAQHDVEITAIASVLLSSKLEECLKTVVTVLSVYCCIKYRRMKLEAGENHALTSDSAPVLDVSSSIFYKLRQATLGCERLLLEKIGFNTYVELPYKFFLNYLNVLQIAKHKTLPQVSWNNLNDCMRTVACVRFPPEVLASAAIYRASKSLNISLPEAPVPWWVLFNATLDDIKSVCALIDDLHLNPTPKLIKVTKTESFVPSDIKEFCAVVTNTDAPSQSQPRQQAAPASSSAPKYQQPRGNDGYFRR